MIPLNANVVIRPDVPKEVTVGGIIIPQNSQEKSSQGEVIAVGPGRLMTDGQVAPLGVKVGDKVLFSKYGSTEVTINDEDLIVISEEHILTILD